MFRLRIEQSAAKAVGLTLLLAGSLLTTAGCVQEMADQPRLEVMEDVSNFDGAGNLSRQVPGTVARGQLREQTPENTGRKNGEPIARIPIQVEDDLLADGRRNFGIWCDHCHGPAGRGDGMVVKRGFPPPPSYHIDRLRRAADGHLFTVITDGFGRMPKFGARINPRDRWAIIAYIRDLQLSQHAPEDVLNNRDRERLKTTNQ